MNQYTEILEKTISRRFEQGFQTTNTQSDVSNDFYMDMLCVFHDPDSFIASDFTKYPISIILNYLQQTHQLYINKSLSELEYAAATLAEHQPELSQVRDMVQEFFGRFKHNLEAHIQEEEKHLFPYIETLNATAGNGQKDIEPSSNKLMDFMLHHDDELEEAMSTMVNELSKLPNHYQKNFAFRMLRTRFSIFELDLRIHGKMEDEVLVPMALQMEQKLKGAE